MDGARSSFGGTFCNPYDTEREPGMSSAGSATAVAANLVTCAIGEETVVSVRWPAAVNSLVGLAPTKELVSTDGMIGAGLNMRVGPMCRTVQDTARILDAIAGYDPKDALTASQRRAHAADVLRRPRPRARLAGPAHRRRARVPEPNLFAKADAESIDLVERAIAALKTARRHRCRSRARGALFQRCIARSAPELLTSAFAAAVPPAVPGGCGRAAAGRSHRHAASDMHADPARVPRG